MHKYYLMLINDDRICNLLNRKDPLGLEYLFDKYYRPLVVWANIYLKDLPASEDIVQDFYVSFWEKGSYEHILPARLKGYLFSAVKYMAIKHVEKKDPLRNPSQVRGLLVEFIDVDDITEDMIRQVEAEIRKLPPRTRDVLMAVYYEGMRYKDVAARFSISTET